MSPWLVPSQPGILNSKCKSISWHGPAWLGLEEKEEETNLEPDSVCQCLVPPEMLKATELMGLHQDLCPVFEPCEECRF